MIKYYIVMSQENKLLDHISEFCVVEYRYEPTSESDVFIVDANDVPIVFSCIADMIDSWELNFLIKVEVVPVDSIDDEDGEIVEVWISDTV